MLKVVKRQKRLFIEDEAGVVAYSPPDFILPLASRADLEDLARRLSVAERPIDEIVAFESRHNRKVGGAHRAFTNEG